MTLMRKILALLLLISLWGLAACQNMAQSETPFIAAEKSPPTIAPTAPIAASPILEPTSVPPTLEPSAEPSAEPTTAPTSAASPTPTNTPIPSAPVDSIKLVPIIEGVFSRPVYLTHAFDERLFVVEQAGVVHILENGQLLPEPFLDIQDRVGSGQLEQGLLSIAFHPDYQQNGRFFAYYTDRAGATLISSYMVSEEDPNHAEAESELVLLSVSQPYPNHNGGQLQFGPDGYLYAGFGDGGSANDPLGSGQDPSTLLGSLLRLDVNHAQDIYAIPASNPFIADENRRNEIWAWGLRNPWRFSFDSLTGDLFIADVGQNIWEEVHFQPAASQGGENYGWNILEASHCFSDNNCDKTGLELPIFEYDHQEGCSITGGYMYRGRQYPALYGNYFFADFCSGNIWRLFPEAEGDWSSAQLLDSNLVISSFGEDFKGDLYVLVHDTGSVFQIQP